MRENNFYHGPIFPETRQFVRDQFHVGDTVEISDLGSGKHVRERYTYTDLATVMYVRPCMAV